MAQYTAVAVAVPATGLTWAQYKAGGLRAALDAVVAANTAKANPTTTLTVSPTGGGASGGLLAAGTYYGSYTFVDAFGETKTGGESIQFTIAAGYIPRVTLPALPTNVNQSNLYLTAANGAAGTETLYATGITATTFDCSYAAPSEPNPSQPLVNTTGVTAETYDILAGLISLNSDYALGWLSRSCSSYLSGDPIERRVAFRNTVRREGILKAWQSVMREISVLEVANQGTFSTQSGPIFSRSVRTFS